MHHDTTLLALALEELCTFHLRRTEDLAAAEPDILDDIYAALRDAMGDALSAMDDELGWTGGRFICPLSRSSATRCANV